jgi:RNA polymerase sigma-70 factor (ECF subfamily)
MTRRADRERAGTGRTSPGIAPHPDVPAPTLHPVPGIAAVEETTGATDLSAAVAAARDGDDESFRMLYRAVQPLLQRYLHALVGHDAEDVASETWLQIVRDLHSFRGDYDGFRGWAATIARHRALDHVRYERRRPSIAVPAEEFGDVADEADPAALTLEAAATRASIELIATLPREQAEAVLLRVVMNLDVATTAQVLGKRTGAVRTAAYRGLRRLAEHLQRPDLTPAPPRVEPSVTSERDPTLKDTR